MFGARRREAQALAAWDRAHAEAASSPAGLRRLMFHFSTLLPDTTLMPGNHAWPWLITQDAEWREWFRQFSKDQHVRGNAHYSLRAHYERMEEIAAEAMFAYVQPDNAMTEAQLKASCEAAFTGFSKLRSMNAQAWAQEHALTDTAGAVKNLLADAENTLSVRELMS